MPFVPFLGSRRLATLRRRHVHDSGDTRCITRQSQAKDHMKRTQVFGRWVMTLALGGTLAACGGGGGGNDGDAGGTPPAQGNGLRVSTANASAAFGESIVAGNIGTMTRDDSAPQASQAGRQLTQTAAARTRQLLARVGSRERAQAVDSEELPCLYGGSAVLTLNTASADGLSKGDSMTIEFRDCAEDGEEIDGTMRHTFVDFNDALTRWVTDTVYTQLTWTAGSQAVRVTQGSMRLTNEDDDSGSLRLVASNGSLSYQRLDAGAVVASATLSGYAFDYAVTPAAISESFSFHASGSFPALGDASFDVQTLHPFVSVGGALPTSGQLRIDGEAGSRATATITGAHTLLEIDSDGDGRVDSSEQKTWAELLASI